MMRMNRSAAIVAAGLLMALPALGRGGGSRMGQIEVGEPFPDLVLPDLEGAPRSVGELRGQKVMLHVFASW